MRAEQYEREFPNAEIDPNGALDSARRAHQTMLRPRELLPAPGVTLITELNPIMSRSDDVWRDARWVGAIEESDVAKMAPRVTLKGGNAYARARLWVRDGISVLGCFDTHIENGELDRATAAEEIRRLPRPTQLPVPPALPGITVAVPTAGRPEYLPALLRSLQALEYPDFEIVIVENSDAPRLRAAVEGCADARIRYLHTTVKGTSHARNLAVMSARHDYVAFTDDDVVADRFWLTAIASAFAAYPEAAVVTGMVPSGQIDSYPQAYFEDRIEWPVGGAAREYHLKRPPTDVPLFPFEISEYGTGANFAVRRKVYLELGGMNEALGGGTPCLGGEDQDLFIRSLFAGFSLVYQPCSIIWHKHRASSTDLAAQLRGYGRGMGALLTTLFVTRASSLTAARTVAVALRRVLNMGKPAVDRNARGADGPSFRRDEVAGLLSGPIFYAYSRLTGRSPRPLARPSAQQAAIRERVSA